MALIEIRPHRWGWKAFEAKAVNAVIRVYDEIGYVVETHKQAGEFKGAVSSLFSSRKVPVFSVTSTI